MPAWPEDGHEMERWGRHVPTLSALQELGLLVVERRLHRLATEESRNAGRREFLGAVKRTAPEDFEKIRVALHRQRRVAQMEARWGRPAGWQTSHMVVAAELRGAQVQELLATCSRPTVAALVHKVKPT